MKKSLIRRLLNQEKIKLILNKPNSSDISLFREEFKKLIK